jgi:TnpA family transposase
MVYSHIDNKSAPIYMQVTRPGDTEVGAMLTGCIHHDSEMDMDEVYTDTHGQSTIGFAFSHLLGFDLCPRIKAMHKQKPFVPPGGLRHQLPNLDLALAGTPINLRKIKDNYNEVVKVTAAVRNRTVEADVLLKRLSADNEKNPVYQALLEIGKARRTIFLCRYLREESFRIQINEMLNVAERHNGTLSFVFHGKQGIISTNNKEDQEIAILCLHLIHTCLAYMNTLMIQEVLEDNPDYLNSLNKSDLRGLTPLLHEHIDNQGILFLDMIKRLYLKIDQEIRI